MKQREFIPVIIGSNKGSYSLARAFHEQYGINSELVIKLDLGATAYSHILNKHFREDLLDNFPQAMDGVKADIDQAYPDVPKMVFGSDDWFVEQLIAHRDLFEPDWLVPYVEESILDRAVNKSTFYEICEEIDIPHPRTYPADGDLSHLPADQAYVVKAADTPVYQNLDFEGKEKVFLCENQKEAEDAIHLIRDAGYDREIVLQDFLDLKATYQCSVTAYRSPHDLEVKMNCFGRVMVEDPTPVALGNNLVIITERAPDKVYQDAERLMEHLDWVGYANFDLIYDEKTDEYAFLEINPRLGMTNYYATAAGGNVAYYYVEDYLKHEDLDQVIYDKQVLFNSIPKFLTKKVVGDTEYWKNIEACYQEGEVYNAFDYPADQHWRRKLYVKLNMYNYYKKFKEINFI